MHWRRKWQPTPGFLPGESQGRGSLVGCCLWVAQSQIRLKQLSSSKSIVKVKSLSRVQLFATPWTVAHQAPPSMGFSRQEYWSGLPFPSPSWQTDGKKMETVADFIFLGSKITVDGDCSHEIKRCLLLGIKAMTNLDSILESRNINLLAKYSQS